MNGLLRAQKKKDLKPLDEKENFAVGEDGRLQEGDGESRVRRLVLALEGTFR